MKKSIVLLLCCSNLLWASQNDYELINFSSSRVRGVSEILNETQMTRDDLIQYTCDNQERESLFNINTSPNLKKDSLKIINKKDEVFTYIDGSLYDSKNNIPRRIRDRFLKSALIALENLERIPEGKRLIEELQMSQYPFYIKLGGNRYDASHLGGRSNWEGNNAGFISMMDDLRPLVDGLPFKQIGFGGMIYWNPNIKAKFIEEDYKKRFVNPDVVLAHEMYHAYDGMRGLLDRRFVKADHLEFQPVCEYRAVRIENILRKAMGGLYRRFYSDTQPDTDTQDMLDEYDMPEVIPTPCIKWL